MVLVTLPQPKPDGLAETSPHAIEIGGADVQKLSVVEKKDGGRAEVREVMPVRFTQLELSG